MTTNLFETATRKQFRFASPVGELTVEDLWSLPLTTRSSRKASLNGVAVALDAQINENSERSFVTSATAAPGTRELKQKLEVVVRIIEVKEAENAAKRNREAAAERRSMLLQRIADKENEAFLSMSKEELEAELKKLESGETEAA